METRKNNGFKKGNQIRNTGRTRFKKGVSSWNKKENPTKNVMHKWVITWKGKPQICEMCGTTTAKKFEWANRDHTYHRVLDDYIRMCTSCHRKYDIENNNYKISPLFRGYKGIK
jgi:hypothetical protein